MNRVLKKEELQIFTQRLLDIKSEKNDYKILDLYNFIYPEDQLEKKNRAFYRLIKVFHPDKLKFHNEKILSKENKTFYNNLFELIDQINSKKAIVINIEYEASYDYDESDFDDYTDMETYYDSEMDNIHVSSKSPDFDLIDAFKSSFIGNDSKVVITPSMISMTTGYIDFSNNEITNIHGIDYFIHIDRLNLCNNSIDNISGIELVHQLKELYISHNYIDNIDYLSSLNNLEILDISDNDIDDFKPLLSMHSLKFVNIRGNKNIKRELVLELEERGIVVLY